MTRLCVQLSGGLGNQMFQYATARALALDKKANLVLDTWSGFARDTQYKRSYELAPFAICGSNAKVIERLPIWIYRFQEKLTRSIKTSYRKTWYGNFYVERDFKFDPQLASTKLINNTWLIGYWQSPKYFNKYQTLLLRELMPPSPQRNKFLALANEMMNCESVSLGVRFYEESINPAKHALHGKLKKIEDINRVINILCAKKPNSRFFVFCTHHSVELDKLDLPTDTIFVTPDEGFSGAIDCLWLLTHCKHHIFTNSTYYWWGAWLSQVRNNEQEQVIYAADNFINVDGLCEHWNRF